MENINLDNLRRIDLNLAMMLVIIHDERSVTRTALRLNLTQPAVSAALGRLRAILNDELFVREGRNLRATPRADELVLLLRRGLVDLQTAFFAQQAFDPATAALTLRIGLLDDLETVLLPTLFRQLRADAPSIRISARNTDFRSITGQIERDEIDIALGVFDDMPKTVFRKEIVRTSYRILFDPSEISLVEPLTRDDYTKLEHVIISFDGSFQALFEERMRSTGKRRQIVASTPRFGGIPYLLRGSSAISTMPAYLATRFAKTFSLATVSAPYVAEEFGIEMVWPVRLNADPAQVWLRGVVAEVLKGELDDSANGELGQRN
jgi:LysR family transcriptional regulator, mexEF-oprN operon transcriptional activator